MRLATYGAIRGVATTAAVALTTCTTWLVGMLAIMASPGIEQAHAFQPFLA